MKPEEVHIGATVRVRERHRIAERRGMVGKVTDHYGGDGYMAVDVRFSGGYRRLFWPEDLEEILAPRPWWRSLLGESREELERITEEDRHRAEATRVSGLDRLP